MRTLLAPLRDFVRPPTVGVVVLGLVLFVALPPLAQWAANHPDARLLPRGSVEDLAGVRASSPSRSMGCWSSVSATALRRAGAQPS